MPTGQHQRIRPHRRAFSHGVSSHQIKGPLTTRCCGRRVMSSTCASGHVLRNCRFPMIFLCYFYGIPMGFWQDFLGGSLEILLHFKGMSMGSPLDSYGIYMVFCMICQRNFYGISMGFKIDFCWIPMIFPWDSYGTPVPFLWDFHDMSMVFLWDYWKVSWNQLKNNWKLVELNWS